VSNLRSLYVLVLSVLCPYACVHALVCVGVCGAFLCARTTLPIVIASMHENQHNKRIKWEVQWKQNNKGSVVSKRHIIKDLYNFH
jgi:hypothetical protein